MSTESFGMALSSLPIPTLPSSTPAESSKKQGSASSDSSGALSANSDPLLAALSQTLTQLGYTMPAGSLDNTDSVDGTTDSAATTTAAQFLAALYQALALQQSISASNGGATSSADAASSVASVADASSSSGSLGAYQDLGSRIADLSSASRGTSAASNDADEWDIDFGDVSAPANDSGTNDDDPLSNAVSSLNDALQAHVSTLDSTPGAAVTLSDVLDGLSSNAGSLTWQPVGVMVDVAI
jgi:hypothetical protein